MPGDATTTQATSATMSTSNAGEDANAWNSTDGNLLNKEEELTPDWSYELADLPLSVRWHAFDQGIPSALTLPNRRSTYELCKRALDIAVSLAILLLTLPLLTVVAILIKATSRGPVFYRQKRLGRGGVEFLCLKFRTMYADADERLKRDKELFRQFEQSFKIKDDPRITKVGALLRKSSIDELPQLLHVLRGEMTLIGPRPIVKPELSKYSIYGNKLLSVKPGLGGLWQVSGRSDLTYPKRVLLDMDYIDHRCLLLDIQLMVLTAIAVFRGHGAC
jgi:lipopolysaccharide/colanic/teichoic acid biosynthesis glycosyltransferase